jgi:Domain of unknown function (DUF4124)
MRRSRQPGSRVLTLVLLVPLLLATTYKWVDRQGQLHYTDTPPPAGIAYEVIAAPHGPPATEPAPSPATPAASPAVAPSPPAKPEVVPAARDDGRCVDALYQLQVLAGQWRVYKPGPGADRTYLHDRDRPAEIERLTRERDANCSEDPATLDSQRRRAGELFQALSPGCREAREKLGNMLRPTARTAPSHVEDQRAFIAAHCPDVSREGVWLQDWILVH